MQVLGAVEGLRKGAQPLVGLRARRARIDPAVGVMQLQPGADDREALRQLRDGRVGGKRSNGVGGRDTLEHEL